MAKLYPDLSTSRVRELRAQYRIDRYDDVPVTICDFAFPDMQIAIYCDGFGPREGDRNAFRRDRLQLRELQLKGWIVLRFAGSEIYSDCDMVVDTIQRAIARRDRQRAWRSQQQQERQHPKIAIPEPPPEPQKPQSQQKTEGGGRNQQPQNSPVQQEQKSWQESMQEWRDDKLQVTPAQQRKHQTQQKPEGGSCGVIFLASVIIGICVLLGFIFL